MISGRRRHAYRLPCRPSGVYFHPGPLASRRMGLLASGRFCRGARGTAPGCLWAERNPNGPDCLFRSRTVGFRDAGPSRYGNAHGADSVAGGCVRRARSPAARHRFRSGATCGRMFGGIGRFAALSLYPKCRGHVFAAWLGAYRADELSWSGGCRNVAPGAVWMKKITLLRADWE